METFIAQTDGLDIWVVLFAITAFALWAERKRFGSFVGGSVIAITAGIFLGNLKFLPAQSPTYTAVDELLLPLAIPLLLFQADIGKILREAGPTLIAFLLGTAGTVLGALIAYALITLPDQQAALTGTFAATFIGGGMNFAAVSQATEIPPGDVLTAAIAADNIMTILFLFVLAVMPAIAWFTSTYPLKRDGEKHIREEAPAPSRGLKALLHGAVAIVIAYALVLIGGQVQAMTGWAGTSILVITILAVVMATFLPALKQFTGNAFGLGMILMLVFFASLGARADFVGTIDTAPVMFAFVFIVIGVHAGVLFGIGKFLNLTLPELITASNACILGPATAAGLAANKGWKGLVTPGILVGILGYAIANFIGVGLANILG